MARFRSEMTEAMDSLCGRDPVLDGLIARHGVPLIPRRAPATRRFHELAQSIAYQQLHGSAAAAIWDRVVATLGGGVVTAAAMLAGDPEDLRGCGLSGAKTRSMLDLADRVETGTLRLGRMGAMDDDAVIDALTPVWGIGRWTAQMFLIFTLGRLDVWPEGDFGVRTGYAKAWGLGATPTEAEMAPIGEPFAGARSLVAWYCWRAAESGDGARSG
ncbi:MAG: hypothetical protein R2698_09505 [Microthrixaceae bacterium]